jgi:hypothetical protein
MDKAAPVYSLATAPMTWGGTSMAGVSCFRWTGRQRHHGS